MQIPFVVVKFTLKVIYSCIIFSKKELKRTHLGPVGAMSLFYVKDTKPKLIPGPIGPPGPPGPEGPSGLPVRIYSS